MSYILDALNRADAERERGSVPGLHARQTYVKTSKVSNEHSRLWMALVATLTIAGIAAGVWFWRAPVDTAPPAIAKPAIAAAAAAAPAPAAPPAPVPTAPVAAPTIAPKAAPKPTLIEKEVVIANVAVSIPLLSELSSSVRSQIPPLTITGTVYSKNPGQRLLLVNNQVLNQGNLAAPEVTLEEIRANSSVFSFRGTRFRLEH
jgi:general secretion pathway protein B